MVFNRREYDDYLYYQDVDLQNRIHQNRWETIRYRGALDEEDEAYLERLERRRPRNAVRTVRRALNRHALNRRIRARERTSLFNRIRRTVGLTGNLPVEFASRIARIPPGAADWRRAREQAIQRALRNTPPMYDRPAGPETHAQYRERWEAARQDAIRRARNHRNRNRS